MLCTCEGWGRGWEDHAMHMSGVGEGMGDHAMHM